MIYMFLSVIVSEMLEGEHQVMPLNSVLRYTIRSFLHSTESFCCCFCHHMIGLAYS